LKTATPGSCKLYRETLFSYEGRFEKEDGELLANKVKESDFEIVSIEKKGNEFAPKLLI
jgi:DNA topoisomerase-3